MVTAVGDASSEAHYEYRGLRCFVNLGNEVGVGSQSADHGSMELATEVTAERACSQVNRRSRYLQELACKAFEALDRAPQCPLRSSVEVDEQVRRRKEMALSASRGRVAAPRLKIVSCRTLQSVSINVPQRLLLHLLLKAGSLSVFRQRLAIKCRLYHSMPVSLYITGFEHLKGVTRVL